MSLIDWSDDLSLGLQEIDKQHKDIIDALNIFYDTVKSDDKFIILSSYDLFIKRVHKNIEYEEKYMRDYSYFLAEKHIDNHNEFEIFLKNLTKNLQDSYSILNIESIFPTLVSLIYDHILIDDKQAFSEMKIDSLVYS